MGRLSGKIALITGVGSGQGRAASVLFAREGARIVGCDVNREGAELTAKLARDAGGEMTVMAPVDLSVEEQAVSWVEKAVAVYGGVDVLYNNASSAKLGPFSTMSSEAWHFTIRNELDLIYYVTKAAWPHLVKRGGGSIINVGSIMAGRADDMPMSAHGATKGAVASLSVHMAVEGGPVGIRANTISPGLIETPATSEFLDDPYAPIHKHVRTSPLGRIGKPEDVAPLALFLASDESAFITGANIVIDGGQTLGVGMNFGLPPENTARFGSGKPLGSLVRSEPIRIDMPDGKADAYLVKPSGKGPWPGVLLYTDIMGVRPVFLEMAERLASAGFVVLLPNLFYRSGPIADPPLSVHNSGEFGRLLTLIPTLTRERIESDSAVYLKTLSSDPDVAETRMGVVGYCMSGAMAVWTASANEKKIGAAASFHGGHLATPAPDSPDKLAAKTHASFYFGFAETDAFMTPEMIAQLRKTLDDARTDYRSHVYEGTYHGFTVKDASYNELAAERHWSDLTKFLGDVLVPNT